MNGGGLNQPALRGILENEMNIATIRRTIESCNWSRNDLGGATLNEFKACDVPSRLNKHIEAVRALKIAPRFTRDIENQAWEIECAEKTIARWSAMQKA